MNCIKRNIKNSGIRENEDVPVLDYISKIYKNGRFSLLEVGSGECRFVKKLSLLFPNAEISCIEINPDLAKIAKDSGFEVINDNVLNVKPEKEYDIVHCSHVIEHFGYPQVAQLLDFLVASTKIGCAIILRSPLMYDKFYYDLDHIRPYPPRAIERYFSAPQTQKVGGAVIEVEKLWYRTSPWQINPIADWNLLYSVKFLRAFLNKLIGWTNRLFFYSWDMFRHPSTKPNGYVMIFRIDKK